MTRLVVDPVLPPRNLEDPQRENGFELLYSENDNGVQIVNKRRSFNFDLVYPIAELK